MHLVGFTTEIYYDARSYKCQTWIQVFLNFHWSSRCKKGLDKEKFVCNLFLKWRIMWLINHSETSKHSYSSNVRALPFCKCASVNLVFPLKNNEPKFICTIATWGESITFPGMHMLFWRPKERRNFHEISRQLVTLEDLVFCSVFTVSKPFQFLLSHNKAPRRTVVTMATRLMCHCWSQTMLMSCCQSD